MQEAGADADLALRQRRMAHVVYGLQAVGVFVNPLGIVAVILAYLRRRQGGDAGLLTHFTWQIRTFWGAFLATLAGAVVLGAFADYPAGLIGLLVIVGAAIWLVYRIIRGWLGLYDGKAMYELYPPPARR